MSCRVIAQFALLVWPDKEVDSEEPAAAATATETKSGKVKDSPHSKKGPKVKAEGLTDQVMHASSLSPMLLPLMHDSSPRTPPASRDQVKSISAALNKVYRSKAAQNYRVGAALAAVCIVALYGTTFYNYGCVCGDQIRGRHG